MQKLDEKNLRAWLYRGNGYFLLGETSDFEKSVAEAKKGNPKELQYIENVVAAIKGVVVGGVGGDVGDGAGDSLVVPPEPVDDDKIFEIE